MASKASIAGHPIHPILVAFPVALWTTSLAMDIWFYFQVNVTWLVISKFLIAAGCIGAVAAAVPGIIDWLAIKEQPVKKVANWHARLNIIALVLFIINLYFRTQAGGHLVGYRLIVPFLMSVVGVGLIAISGWLGGELVFRYGMGRTD
jgi:uncharacterized membrane protein